MSVHHLPPRPGFMPRTVFTGEDMRRAYDVIVHLLVLGGYEFLDAHRRAAELLERGPETSERF